MTVVDIASKLNITDKLAVAGLVKFLEAKGILVRSGVRKSASGKGKGANVYSLGEGIDVSNVSDAFKPLFAE